MSRSRLRLLVPVALLLGACSAPTPEVAADDEQLAPTAATDCWGTPADGAPAPAEGEPGELAVEELGRGFRNPVQVLEAPDGSLLVVELPGSIRTLEDKQVLLDIREDVADQSEQGLLGATFTPDGQRLLVHYTEAPAGDTVVTEHAWQDGELGPATRLLRLQQPSAAHNGGSLLFAPDGHLYLSLGDGGVSENGRDLDTPFGGILRFDACEPGRLVSADDVEEFTGRALWMAGLRNPYRIAFDGDDVVVADVGLDTFEEINVVPRAGGQDLGWPAYEGTSCNLGPCEGDEGFVAPTVELSHDDGWCAVIGGVVYRGDALPWLRGSYLYGDFCRPGLHALDLSDPAAGGAELAAVPEGEGRLLGFGLDGDGEVLLTTNQGRVLRLVPAA